MVFVDVLRVVMAGAGELEGVAAAVQEAAESGIVLVERTAMTHRQITALVVDAAVVAPDVTIMPVSGVKHAAFVIEALARALKTGVGAAGEAVAGLVADVGPDERSEAMVDGLVKAVPRMGVDSAVRLLSHFVSFADVAHADEDALELRGDVSQAAAAWTHALFHAPLLDEL